MRTKWLLVLITIGVAISALPASASAGVWHLEPSSDFTGTGGETRLTDTLGAMVCTSATAAGVYATPTTGFISLHLHGCKSGGANCTSKNEPTGTVSTAALPFENILLEANPQTAGILIKPGIVDNMPAAGEGLFTEFICGLTPTAVRGNGLLGDITGPKCGESGKVLTVEYTSSVQGTQRWLQITTTGTKYDLTSKTGMAGYMTSSIDGVLTLNLEKEGKVNCTT
jgi:hypothetical protein